MARQHVTATSTTPGRRCAGRRGHRLAAVALLAALAAGCAPASSPSGAEVGPRAASPVEAVVYRTATCDCCKGHADHLRAAGFEVRSVVVEDLHRVKEELGVPPALGSCHTTVVDGYFVEGHVPADAVHELLSQRPAIDGITLPGMPAGSPGMPGQQQEEFVILAVTGGDTEVFATR